MNNHVANRGCLQRARSQTFTANKEFYKPHTRCDPKFEGWLRRDEKEIDARFRLIKSSEWEI